VCNDQLLQLIECIESLKVDVKKKMMLKWAFVACTKVTRDHRRRFFAREILYASIFAGENSAATMIATL
jgi:hypothetical protein